MNKVYSILVRGREKGSSHYRRAVDSTVAYSGWETAGELLVPSSSEASYGNYMADQLIGICLKSNLNSLLASIDPLHTYDHGFGPIKASTTIGALPGDLALNLEEPSFYHTWIDKTIPITINANGAAIVNGVPQSFTTENNLTSLIKLAEGVSMRVRGAIPVVPFNVVVTMARQPSRDLAVMTERLRKLDIPWKSRYADYKNTLNVNDWLAAFILNYCEVVDGS